MEYKKNDFKSILLEKLDSLNIPVAIFVNEGLVYKTQFEEKNIELLTEWESRDYITTGNHTFAHTRLSDVDLETFIDDIEKGERLSRSILDDKGKTLEYFRFPYNDLGDDSLTHTGISEYLISKGYTTIPFTVESSDWMLNAIYQYYLDKGEVKEAEKIGAIYIEKTLEYFSYFEKLTEEKYSKPIKQIYLCHDNLLNSVYLSKLIEGLKHRGYQFISLAEALADPVYSQSDAYYKKWGISWVYRWEKSKDERRRMMMAEPSFEKIETLYSELYNQ